MNEESLSALLNECLSSLGLALDEEKTKKFTLFYEELTAFNLTVNVTAIEGERDFAIKHIADSLTALPYIKASAAVCDIGPGGGFPSIPLKIMRPDLSFTLFESHGKKTDFINRTAKLLGLAHIECLHMRAEDAAKKTYREKFDVCVIRAVAKLNTLLEYAMPLLKIGGILIAYKTDCVAQIDEAKSAAIILGASEPATHALALPISNDARTIVVYQKLKKTDTKYPRGGNKERLMPL